MVACTCLLVLSTALFVLALCRSQGAVSYREALEVDGGQLGVEGDEDPEQAPGPPAAEAAAEPRGHVPAEGLEEPLLAQAPP